MKIILNYIFKNIKANAKTSILIFLLLTFFAFIIYNCIGIDKTIEEKYELSLRDLYGYCDILAKYYSKDEALDYTKDVLNKKNINADGVEIDCTIKNVVVDTANSSGKQFVILNTDLKKANSMRLFPEFTLHGNTVAITKSDSESLNLSIGKVIYLTDPNGDKITLQISDIISNERFFKSNNKSPYLIVSNDIWKRLNCSDSTKYVFLDVKDELISQSIELLENNNVDVSKLVDQNMIRRVSQNIKKLFWIILVFVFLICFFVINSITKLIDYKRREAIGTFRSIGATAFQTICIFLLENIIYSLCGGIAGGVLAVILENTVAEFFMSGIFTVIEKRSVIQIILKLLITISLTLIANLLVSFNAVCRQCRRNIKSLIIEKKEKKYEPSIGQFGIGFIMLMASLIMVFMDIDFNFFWNIMSIVLISGGITLVLPYLVRIISKFFESLLKRTPFQVLNISNKNIRYNQVIINNIKLITVLAMLMLTVNVVANSVSSFFLDQANIYKCNFVVENICSEKELENMENALKSENDSKLVRLYSVRDNINIDNREVNITIVSDYENERLKSLFSGIEYEESLGKLNEDEIIVDKDYCSKYGLQIGDIVTLFRNNSINMKYKIVGTCTSKFWENNKQAIVIPHNKYVSMYGDVPSAMLIKAKTNRVGDVKKILLLNIGSLDTKILDVADYKKRVWENNREMLFIVEFVMLIGMGMAAICIAANQIMSFYLRKRELGILYSTSMSKMQIIRMLLYETILSEIISLIVSIGGIVMLIKVVNKLIKLLDISIHMQLMAVDIMISMMLISLLVIVASVMPIGKMKKFDVIKAIKYE